MLEKVDLSRSISKQEYKEVRPHLQRRLYDLEKACWDAKVASVIVFEGWDTSGKGTAIRLLTSRLDPRGFKLHPIQAPRSFETQLPWLYRFWVRVPNYGEMAIFDRSWYGRVLVERVEGLVSEQSWRQAYRDIVSFERTIADDGHVLMKFFLHISKEQQARRFQRLESDPLTSWVVQPEDWEHHRKYDEYTLAIEEMLERTDTEWGPWNIVAATSKRWSRAKILQIINARLEDALVERGIDLPPVRPPRRKVVGVGAAVPGADASGRADSTGDYVPAGHDAPSGARRAGVADSAEGGADGDASGEAGSTGEGGEGSPDGDATGEVTGESGDEIAGEDLGKADAAEPAHGENDPVDDSDAPGENG